MAVDHIRYDLLTQDALRGVVRTVLSDAAKSGLPGDHHFYISFDTRADGVRLSPRMLAQYPEEMTVVLQHQFWDLTVTEDSFEVGLAFGGIPERLAVPFTAVKAFLDPSVQFGVQFEEVNEQADNTIGGAEKARKTAKSKARATQRPRIPVEQKDARRPAPPPVPVPANPPLGHPGAAPDKTSGGEVVRLDRFRKK